MQLPKHRPIRHGVEFPGKMLACYLMETTTTRFSRKRDEAFRSTTQAKWTRARANRRRDVENKMEVSSSRFT